MMRICTVVVHHKGKNLLDECLRSVLASEEVEVSAVVVANACQESLPEFVSQESRLHVVESEIALGFSAANNLGVRHVRELGFEPDFFLFLNNDARVEPRTLGRLVDAAEKSPRCGVVGPRLMIWGGTDVLNSLGLNMTRVGEAWDEGIGIALEDYGELPPRRSVLAVTGAALMIRSGLLAELDGWEDLYEYYYEDIDLCLRARSKGWDVVADPHAAVWHAVSATAARASDFKLLLTWRNRLLLMAIHWPTLLLARTAPRLLWAEVRVLVARCIHRSFRDAGLQVRAWLRFLKIVPAALKLRRRWCKEASWEAFLWPPGSVPVITLPELPPHAQVQSAAGEVPE